ncbi:unnamed protein product [Acanthoscelides obtectus]|uniref:Uncharacterized protein n=1 Tax=Acanthoscelides obtectus TaxID=200917 RepID=A0A9P0PNW4_ACAOB|nr:unnamed protein product [Acanthoscelides obtectus]CAK1667849.1 hypothetical protein AOBTE_LOCUS26068 [Acanthoscelides obtectus]
MEISLAPRYINDILFRLDMGLLAADLQTIQMTHPPSTSSSSSTPPTSLQDTCCSNPSTPSASLEVVGDVQLEQQLESRDTMSNDIRDFVANYTTL